MGKCGLRTTIIPGPCLFLSSWADKAAESTYKLSLYLPGTGFDTSVPQPQTRTLQHVPSDPFTISQENTEGFGCFLLGDSFGGEKEERNGKTHSWIFYLCTQVLEDFVDLLKSTEPKDNTRDKKWGHMSDRHHQDSVKEHKKDPWHQPCWPLSFLFNVRSKGGADIYQTQVNVLETSILFGLKDHICAAKIIKSHNS